MDFEHEGTEAAEEFLLGNQEGRKAGGKEGRREGRQEFFAGHGWCAKGNPRIGVRKCLKVSVGVVGYGVMEYWKNGMLGGRRSAECGCGVANRGSRTTTTTRTRSITGRDLSPAKAFLS